MLALAHSGTIMHERTSALVHEVLELQGAGACMRARARVELAAKGSGTGRVTGGFGEVEVGVAKAHWHRGQMGKRLVQASACEGLDRWRS
jgi:hypothetical protein